MGRRYFIPRAAAESAIGLAHGQPVYRVVERDALRPRDLTSASVPATGVCRFGGARFNGSSRLHCRPSLAHRLPPRRECRERLMPCAIPRRRPAEAQTLGTLAAALRR